MFELMKGTCMTMCSNDEYKMRKKNNMIHDFEKGPNGVPHPSLAVKVFSRSAAGYEGFRPEDLRPPSVCMDTVKHLITEIMLKREFTPVVYAFVFDRLRAVRQDLTIQGVRNETTVAILEICVRFHLYSSYMLCEESKVIKFDPVINHDHLVECLKFVLVLYDELNYESRLMGEMAAVYLLLDVGSCTPLNWILSPQQERLRNNFFVRKALELNRHFLERNYVAFFRKLQNLSMIFILALHWSLRSVYREIFKVMTFAYSSKGCNYPLGHFCDLFCLTREEAFDLAECLGVPILNNNLRFLKPCFLESAEAPRKRIRFIDTGLDKMIVNDFLMKAKKPLN